MQSPAPKIWAAEHTIPVLQPEKLDEEFYTELSKEQWDLFVVVAYGKIIPQRIIDLPTHGTINVHYSLLPKYRGATPVESSILNGDTTTGVTIQQMVYKLDAGAILATKEIPIEADDTTPTLRAKLNNHALILLPDTMKLIFDGTSTATAQDESSVTTCTKISKEDGELDPSGDPVLNDRNYRAYSGWPGSYFFVTRRDTQTRIKITKAHLSDGQFVLDEVIPENGKRLNYEQYLSWLSVEAF
jgi:methionyl-tRNA formyltransferase